MEQRAEARQAGSRRPGKRSGSRSLGGSCHRNALPSPVQWGHRVDGVARPVAPGAGPPARCLSPRRPLPARRRHLVHGGPDPDRVVLGPGTGRPTRWSSCGAWTSPSRRRSPSSAAATAARPGSRPLPTGASRPTPSPSDLRVRESAERLRCPLTGFVKDAATATHVTRRRRSIMMAIVVLLGLASGLHAC